MTRPSTQFICRDYFCCIAPHYTLVKWIRSLLLCARNINAHPLSEQRAQVLLMWWVSWRRRPRGHPVPLQCWRVPSAHRRAVNHRGGNSLLQTRHSKQAAYGDNRRRVLHITLEITLKNVFLSVGIQVVTWRGLEQFYFQAMKLWRK